MRSELNPARTSSEKSCGCSPAAKWPPFSNLVVMDKFGLRPLCPTPRGWIELVREDAHGNRLTIESQKFSIIQTLLSLVIPAMAMSRPFGAGTP